MEKLVLHHCPTSCIVSVLTSTTFISSLYLRNLSLFLNLSFVSFLFCGFVIGPIAFPRHYLFLNFIALVVFDVKKLLEVNSWFLNSITSMFL